MTMSFNTTKLSGNRVLVKGEDQFGSVGQTVLDSTEWEEIKAHDEYHTNVESFNEAVEDFFAPIIEAAEALNKKAEKPQDPAAFIVYDEGEEATPGRPKHVVRLSGDSLLLRLLEDNQFQRLVWVDNNLEVLEYVAPSDETVPVDGAGEVESTEG